jgi:hypothetical protein
MKHVAVKLNLSELSPEKAANSMQKVLKVVWAGCIYVPEKNPEQLDKDIRITAFLALRGWLKGNKDQSRRHVSGTMSDYNSKVAEEALRNMGSEVTVRVEETREK